MSEPSPIAPEDLRIEEFTAAYSKPLHPAVADARELMELEQRAREDGAGAAAEQERRELNRVWRAVLLAKDIDTARALLERHDVPLHHLRPEWVRRIRFRR